MNTSLNPDGPDSPARTAGAADGGDCTARAVAAMTEAARTEHDFSDWLARALGAVAGELGGSDALTIGRPGSWEASLVDQLVKGTVGYGDEYLPLPAWRTRAPEFSHAAYGVAVGEIDDYLIIAAGHVDPRRFLAAANHFMRHAHAGYRLGGDFTAARPAEVRYLHARHAHDSTPQQWRLELDGSPGPGGSPVWFPVTVLGD